VIDARWSEIDLEGRVWIVPATRMKAGREHRVPLTEQVLEILTDMRLCALGSLFFLAPDVAGHSRTWL